MTDLKLQNVWFSYEDRTVLENVSLTFPAGRTTVLMGPSGIGKTTVFRLISGLEKPQRGQVTGIPEDGAGVLFQEDRLFPQFSILENIAVCAPERTEEEILRMLTVLGLQEEAGRYPAELSGGMRRRAALIRALAVSRQLYLLDEPFNGLDAETKKRTARWIREILRGKTAVIITHQIEDAEALDGEILQLEEKGR